jgi:uncharacterized membrane protein
MIDVAKARKTAIWFVPLLLLVTAGSVWGTFFGLVPMIRDLAVQPASLRVGSLGFLQPVGMIMFLSILVLVFLRIRQFEKAANWVEKRVLIPVVVGMLILIPMLIIGGSLLQRHYLPKMGYHYCDKLSGGPSMWSNDWVKDPELCVYQKTHEWVREQAPRKGK